MVGWCRRLTASQNFGRLSLACVCAPLCSSKRAPPAALKRATETTTGQRFNSLARDAFARHIVGVVSGHIARIIGVPGHATVGRLSRFAFVQPEKLLASRHTSARPARQLPSHLGIQKACQQVHIERIKPGQPDAQQRRCGGHGGRRRARSCHLARSAPPFRAHRPDRCAPSRTADPFSAVACV